MDEEGRVEIRSIVRGHDAGYLGFIDSRESLGGDTIYVLDGDFSWLLRQKDSIEVLLRGPGKMERRFCLGEVRDRMQESNVVVLTDYETYRTNLVEKGVTPYTPPKVLVALAKICLKE